MSEFLTILTRGVFSAKRFGRSRIFSDRQKISLLLKSKNKRLLKYDHMELETRRAKLDVEFVWNVYQEGPQQVIMQHPRYNRTQPNRTDALKASMKNGNDSGETIGHTERPPGAHLLIDRNGNILEVNDTWKRFAAGNG
jgi:hypothetical protein